MPRGVLPNLRAFLISVKTQTNHHNKQRQRPIHVAWCAVDPGTPCYRGYIWKKSRICVESLRPSLAIGRTLQAVLKSISRGMGQASHALPASLLLVEAAGIEDKYGADICHSPCIPWRQNYPCSLSPWAESLQAGDRPRFS